jgi:hypothetical protein
MWVASRHFQAGVKRKRCSPFLPEEVFLGVLHRCHASRRRFKTIPEFNISTGIHDENASDSGQIILMISFSQSLYLNTYNAVNAYRMYIVRLPGIPLEERSETGIHG